MSLTPQHGIRSQRNKVERPRVGLRHIMHHRRLFIISHLEPSVEGTSHTTVNHCGLSQKEELSSVALGCRDKREANGMLVLKSGVMSELGSGGAGEVGEDGERNRCPCFKGENTRRGLP